VKVRPLKIPIDSVHGLTSDGAMGLCRKVLGVKDDENSIFKMGEVHTGYSITYLCEAAVEYKGIQYYAMRVMWDPDSPVWSTIGFLFVSASGDEIFDGIQHSGGTYSFGIAVWNSSAGVQTPNTSD